VKERIMLIFSGRKTTPGEIGKSTLLCEIHISSKTFLANSDSGHQIERRQTGHIPIFWP